MAKQIFPYFLKFREIFCAIKSFEVCSEVNNYIAAKCANVSYEFNFYLHAK